MPHQASRPEHRENGAKRLSTAPRFRGIRPGRQVEAPGFPVGLVENRVALDRTQVENKKHYATPPRSQVWI